MASERSWLCKQHPVRTGRRDTMNPSSRLAGGLFPSLLSPGKPRLKKKKCGTWSSLVPTQSEIPAWTLHRFLKICYAPDTLQGSRLVGGRDCLHGNWLGCSKCPLGACLSLEEGLPNSWTLSGAERGFTKEMMPEPDLLFFSCTGSSWLCAGFL